MTTAIVLAAGKGKRVGGDIPKQFLTVDGVPLIVKTLRVFEESPVIDEILLVTSEEYREYCEESVVRAFALRKVRKVVIGGAERYDSVYQALLEAEGSDFVMIHDGARPFVDAGILERMDRAMREFGAAAAGMPSKDTVKIADEAGFAATTPDRSHVWMIQTPQAFSYRLIREANELLMREGRMNGVTDDAMIVEMSGLSKVKLVEGSYANIKITTPEDLKFLEIKQH